MKRNPITTVESKTTPTEPQPTLPLRSTISYELVVPTRKPPPDPRDIRKAIETLAAAQLLGALPVTEGSAGDVFLLYDLCLRAHGRKPYRVSGQVALHGILTERAMPEAASEIEKALQGMIRPLRTHGLSLVGEGVPPAPLLEEQPKFLILGKPHD